eukprot:m.196172 g.196172  ORF g.196172 m.196172 type:complete len:279 (+) comp19706_c0_seq1:76-912(+)
MSKRTRHRPPPLALIPEGGGVAGPAAVRPDAPVAATAAASDATAGPVLGVLLVRAIPDVVFTDPEAKDRLVERLREYGSVRDVDLLPEYNAVRIRYETDEAASRAATELSKVPYLGSALDCITGATLQQSASDNTLDPAPDRGPMDLLQVPTLEKQWLISPPPSPPPGWRPRVEDPPVVNMALVEALQGLDPSQEREIHAASEGLPAITVQLADCSDSDNDDNEDMTTTKDGRKIPMFSMPPPWARAGPTHGAPWSGKDGTTLKTSRPPLSSKDGSSS